MEVEEGMIAGVEVEEVMIAGGWPYLGGEGGGEEIWSSWSEGWSEEEEEW